MITPHLLLANSSSFFVIALYLYGLLLSLSINPSSDIFLIRCRIVVLLIFSISQMFSIDRPYSENLVNCIAAFV